MEWSFKLLLFSYFTPNKIICVSGNLPASWAHLADQVGASGARVSGQEQQQGSQYHCIQDEERVVDYNSNQDQIPGLLPWLTAGTSASENSTDHVDAEERDAKCSIHASCQPPEDDMDARAMNGIALQSHGDSDINLRVQKKKLDKSII